MTAESTKFSCNPIHCADLKILSTNGILDESPIHLDRLEITLIGRCKENSPSQTVKLSSTHISCSFGALSFKAWEVATLNSSVEGPRGPLQNSQKLLEV